MKLRLKATKNQTDLLGQLTVRYLSMIADKVYTCFDSSEISTYTVDLHILYWTDARRGGHGGGRGTEGKGCREDSGSVAEVLTTELP